MPWWQDDDVSSSGPIKVDGGLKARSTRGSIATTWWSKRFIAVLDAMQLTGRMTRGRNYARSGQVLSLTVAAGKVLAQVQGSRPAPYAVKLISKPLTTAQWDLVTAKLADQALYAAKLLAGEMPPEVEQIFAELDVPLFPSAARDLPMHCSCPDWASPCKHVAAVCYLLAERFDDDPFLIFEWRGRGRAELLEGLRARRGGTVEPVDLPEEPAEPPLAESLDGYFTLGPLPALPRPSAGRLLDQLAIPAVTLHAKPITEALAPLYTAMAPPEPPLT